MRAAAHPQQSVELGQQVVRRSGRVVAVEQRVELVVQRPDAFRQADVLGGLGEVARMRRRTVEALDEVREHLCRTRQAGAVAFAAVDHARAEDEHEPAREHRPGDVAEVVFGHRFGRSSLQRGLLAEDRPVELLERRARLEPELLDERLARIVVCLQCLRLTPRSVEREHQLSP